jgi:hypothetical protein
MNVIQADFETRVRVRAGSPPLEEVPTAAVTEAVNAALREYGRHRGPQTVEVMQTVVEQQEYTLPVHLVTVDEVIWGEDVDVRGDMFMMRDMASPFESLLGLDTFKSPSLLNMLYQQLEDFRSQFAGKWEVYDAPTGGALRLRLSPPPAIAQHLAVIGKRASTLANVPERDAELLLDGCLWKLSEMRGNGGSGIASASFGGGSLSFGTKHFLDAAQRYEERFRAASGATAPKFITG